MGKTSFLRKRYIYFSKNGYVGLNLGIETTSSNYSIIDEYTNIAVDAVKFVFVENDNSPDKASIHQVSYPIGTTIKDNNYFLQEWIIKNTGTTTWDSSYSFKHISGNLSLNPSDDIQIEKTIEPGSFYTLKIYMKAPDSLSSEKVYREEWQLVNPEGNTVRINDENNLITQIIVPGLFNPTSECPETLSYNRETIIPDNEARFVEISPAAIQEFLEDRNSILSRVDTDVYQLDPKKVGRGGKSWSVYIQETDAWNIDELNDDKPTIEEYTPAEIIYYAAKENKINPVLLLAYIQKEMQLISETSSDNLQHKLNRATGYGMGEGGDNSKYYSFLAQLTGTSYEIDFEMPKYEKEYTKVIDGETIIIRSAFAHYHYDYTPHFLSATSLF
ncbi:MAG: hypothetical protein OMM_04300 [Candidatus Magnetoglobus multicellularis str. Araruama]|uniref:Nbr1 FW domain-containing protein n=1 Tax=Candidatus Magnetoglobus multicellularis str. Araruama TaxID=890399 RepID=A0A1V1P1Y0_9BACT|nr:MAG: hypothetical protein OMM_04300 [Candidatus Magnetoglobus multicellularis str. Araruama]